MTREHPKTVQSREHFNRIAADYDALFVPRMRSYERVHDIMLTTCPEDAYAMRVLELGMGTGNLTKRLVQHLPKSRIVGYDLSGAMLEQARKKLAGDLDRIALVEQDISRADFHGPFDIVVSAFAVHHVPPRSKPGLFRRCYQALSPGGFLVIADTFRRASPRLVLAHRRFVELTRKSREGQVDSSANDRTSSLPRIRRDPSGDGGSPTQMRNYIRWMEQAGFRRVDCVFKFAALAVLYGERPEAP